jgi:predicted enzyme related to lactoylglutathione lyase
MPGKLVHFEVPAKDTKRAKAFYSSVFGWEFGDSAMPGMEYFLTQAGGEPGGAVYTHEEMSPHIFVYFDTDDIEASIEKVRGSGGEAPDKQPIPGVGWFSHCKDTEGNSFGLFQSDESVPAPGPQ